MAGAGYKLFNTGDVLTAAQVNTYLMEQTVMVFANATARTSALSGVLAEGMVSYLQDTNALEVYNGSAWVGAGSSGDIEGVTAGVGISGGGTSGTVTITNSMATAIDAKGDLIVGTGADTFARLAVGGTNGHVLQVDSSTATGLKWAAAAGGGGKVLQVVNSTYSTTVSSNSNVYVDTGLSATITPTSATSTILVMVSQIGNEWNTNNGIYFNLLRGATEIWSTALMGLTNGSLGVFDSWQLGWHYVDSPATTSATTYKTQVKSRNSTTVYVQKNSTTSIMTLLEIGA